MRRVTIFLVLLLAGVASYVVVAFASAALLGWAGYGGMMGGMGGWGMQASPYSGVVWLLSFVALATAAVGGAGLIYYVFNPEPAAQAAKVETMSLAEGMDASPQRKAGDATEAALKVLKPDELQVIEVLRRNGNGYLQKWIAKETGMSRLQTHRVVARLVERNMVTVTKSGNTNEVRLAPWLVGDGERA